MIRATRRLCLATLLLLPLGCATASGPAPVAFATPEAAPLPNATLATSIPLVPGEETTGALQCGQVAWYRIATPTVRPYVVTILGQAQENSLGATATLTVTDAAYDRTVQSHSPPTPSARSSAARWPGTASRRRRCGPTS